MLDAGALGVPCWAAGVEPGWVSKAASFQGIDHLLHFVQSAVSATGILFFHGENGL